MTDQDRLLNLLTALDHVIEIAKDKKLSRRERQDIQQIENYVKFERERLTREGK